MHIEDKELRNEKIKTQRKQLDSKLSRVISSLRKEEQHSKILYRKAHIYADYVMTILIKTLAKHPLSSESFWKYVHKSLMRDLNNNSILVFKIIYSLSHSPYKEFYGFPNDKATKEYYNDEPSGKLIGYYLAKQGLFANGCLPEVKTSFRDKVSRSDALKKLCRITPKHIPSSINIGGLQNYAISQDSRINNVRAFTSMGNFNRRTFHYTYLMLMATICNNVNDSYPEHLTNISNVVALYDPHYVYILSYDDGKNISSELSHKDYLRMKRKALPDVARKYNNAELVSTSRSDLWINNSFLGIVTLLLILLPKGFFGGLISKGPLLMILHFFLRCSKYLVYNLFNITAVPRIIIFVIVLIIVVLFNIKLGHEIHRIKYSKDR